MSNHEALRQSADCELEPAFSTRHPLGPACAARSSAQDARGGARRWSGLVIFNRWSPAILYTSIGAFSLAGAAGWTVTAAISLLVLVCALAPALVRDWQENEPWESRYPRPTEDVTAYLSVIRETHFSRRTYAVPNDQLAAYAETCAAPTPSPATARHRASGG